MAQWKVHAYGDCLTCGKQFTNYKNAQALSAQHSRKYGHIVMGEVGFAFSYGDEGKDHLLEVIRDAKGRSQQYG